MKNFLRAFRFAWRYRLRLAVSVACALLAAVFWGLNFTAIYPVLKILGSDKNLQQWLDKEIADTQQNIDKWRTNVDELTRKRQELMARFTNDMELLGGGLKTMFGKVIAEPLRALACVVVACWISWQLTLMFLVLVPVALFILTKVGRTMKRASRRLLERMSNIYKILQESFSGIRIIN